MNKSCDGVPFRALVVSQFAGAFNDNALKVLVSMLALRQLSGASAMEFISMLGVVFIVPFVVFGPLAGMIADHFPKRRIVIVMEAVKVLIMFLAWGAIASGKLWAMAGVLFLSMTESAFYSPAKYGILPEMLNEDELSKGNGYLTMWTFIAIILGTMCGGVLGGWFRGHEQNAALILAGVGCVGWAASFWVRSDYIPSKERKLSLNFAGEAWQALCGIQRDRGLFLTLLALCLFSFLGAVFQMNILLYGTRSLELAEMEASGLLVAITSGLALGGVLAGTASEGKVELGLVPIGALGMGGFCLALGFVPGGYWGVLLVLFLLGVSAGFYNIPLNSFFQRWSPDERRGQYLAGLSAATSTAVFLASGFLWLCARVWGLRPEQVFIVAGAVSLLASGYILAVLPQAMVRLVAWVLAHTVYRLRVKGQHNVPERGGALLVCNHISFVDAVMILAALRRPVRFIMYRDMYELPVINWFCRAVGVIPLDASGGPKATANTLKQAREAIRSGELVCIFPEGHLTRTGNMLAFRKGFEWIMQGVTEPVIPLYLDNIWGSIFSFHRGKYFWKWPRKAAYPVGIVFGCPLSPSVKGHEVRIVVQELGAEANVLRNAWRKKLHLAFISEVKRHPLRQCMADSSGARFTYPAAFAAAAGISQAIFNRHRLHRESQEMIGILLPSSCAAALANLAVAFAGKVPVNLNFTLSSEAFDACIRQCSMRTIITSRQFVRKLGMPERNEMVFLEDVRDQVSPLKTAWTVMCAHLLPYEILSRIFVRGERYNVDDTATVIFSSGSTGQPKGVMLTHANIYSNIENFYQVFNIKDNDVVVAALPFFHSFGFTATLCFPLGTAVGVVYHTNPLDAGIIGKLAGQHKGTILMGTPTFLSAYVKKCSKEQFAYMRMAIVGAEKLKQELAAAFGEKFGFTPFEGYGASELSPIVTVGFPDFVSEATREVQIGSKAGKVGHPIPGVAVKVVDPDTFELKGPEEEGLLLVKGANVMKGYLNEPAKTAEVLKEGWYVTGDIVAIDEDGFIRITDRMSRFSKIGGEMVPHVRIEENILQVLGSTDHVVAVCAVADEKKGERLIVLHSVDLDVERVSAALSERGLPNLWIPKKESYFRVEALPVLGTGKIDLKGIKAMARELVQAREQERGKGDANENTDP